MTMAKRIKELRQQNNMTLLQVANRLGVSEATAQRYESGKIENLKYDTIVRLSQMFNVTPSYLMGWSDIDEETERILKSTARQKQRREQYERILDQFTDEELNDIEVISKLLTEDEVEKVLSYAQFLASQRKE